MSDTSYNTYDKITSIDWNGQHFILTARDEITGNSFAYSYSTDGIHWTKSDFYTNVTTSNPYTVKAFGDKTIIAGNLKTSNTQGCFVNVIDGAFPVAINADHNATVYDIERNIEQPHRIVFPKTAVLSIGSNTFAYSDTAGQSWSNIQNSPFSVSVNDAVWNGKQWVAVGTGNANTIATSLDGISWIGRGNYIFSTSCNGIDWCPEQKKYVAIGSGTNVLATSMDGIYWRGTNTALFSVEGVDIKWNGKIWVATGINSISGNTIAYSLDAISWQYAAVSFQTSGGRIYYDENAVWTVYGTDPSYNIATSSDGINWTLSYSAAANASTHGLVAFPDPSLNLYPSVPFPLLGSTANKYVYNQSERGYAYIQPISIACGTGACSMAHSIDGIQWTAVNNSLFTKCNRAVWNGCVWTAVGTGEYWVATSPDGLNWTGREKTIMAEGYDIAWNGTYLVAVGTGGSYPMARSADNGVTWEAITGAGFATTHAIEWTGEVWLAYGSGGNTTAISSSLNASSWSHQNLCVMDCSNILLENTTNISASSVNGANATANAFDGSFNTNATKWSSASSNYDASGNYIGANATQGISGEWLQVQLSSSRSCANYYVVFTIADASSIPRTFSILGSANGSAWTVLDTFNYGLSASIPDNNWKYPFVCLPLSINPNNIAAYSYYRIVFSNTFGADYVSVAEVALFNSGSQQLQPSIRPVVLKDLVLHPTRILSVDGVVPNIYRITDLSGNLIRNNIVHGNQHVNNIIYGLTTPVTANIFDGVNHIVCSASGEVSYLSNTASNTNLNFDNSLNGVAMPSVSHGVGCFNRKYILLGNKYGDISSSPVFYSGNLSSLLTINSIASNSGYGFVVSPNRIYLGEDDKLDVITPKFYDAGLSSDTSISFNVYKSL
jgi:hypothetical protein